MQQVVVVIALLFSSILMAQTKQETTNTITAQAIEVSVTNVSSDQGTVGFALYNEATFMKAAPISAAGAPIKNGVSTVTFENIPAGEYAIICYHDANGNNRMDFDTNGMPKEAYGTSNNAMNFGPPQFDNSKFEVNSEDIKLEIKF